MKPVNEMTVEEQKEWLVAELRKSVQKFVDNPTNNTYDLRTAMVKLLEERFVDWGYKPNYTVELSESDPSSLIITYTPLYPITLNIVIEKSAAEEEDTSDFITCDDCSGWASQTTANGHAPTCSHVQLCTCGHVEAEHKWKNRPPPISHARALVCTVEGCTCCLHRE